MAGEYIEFDNNNQPAVNDTNLNRLQQLIKQDIVGTIGGDTMPIGAIIQFGSNTIPTNWLLCDGSAVSRTTYQNLFNTIGTTYGQGDGFSTFNLPNLVTTNEIYIIKATQSAGIIATVIDNLNSSSTTDALSANQGKTLAEQIETMLTYSTGETRTGKTWIDGKPIYRKVMNCVNTTTNQQEFAHNIANVDKIWVTQDSFLLIEGIALPANYFRESGVYLYAHANRTHVATRVTAAGWLNKTMYVTVEYTKTTD